MRGRSATSAAGERRMNPHFRVRADPGVQASREARVFAVDENIDVAAKLSLLVAHAVAETRMLARERFENFRHGHARVGRQPELDQLATAGPSAQRRRNMHAHRYRTVAVLTHRIGGRYSAIACQLSPS